MEYKSNSYRSKQPSSKPAENRTKVEKVVDGKVRLKKKSGVRKFTDVFIADDISSVKEYLVMDVLIPNVKKAISDCVETLLYGESGRGKKSASVKTPYRSYYEKTNERARTSYGRLGYEVKEIVFENRGDAEKVLIQMDDILETYPMVSVADLYDLVGITGKYTDCNYGWTDIHSASVVRTDDGYLIKLPRPLPLD